MLVKKKRRKKKKTWWPIYKEIRLEAMGELKDCPIPPKLFSQGTGTPRGGLSTAAQRFLVVSYLILIKTIFNTGGKSLTDLLLYVRDTEHNTLTSQ